MPRRFYLLAEGDSWFAYPANWVLFTYGVSNALAHLRKLTRNQTIIASLASNGDTAANMFAARNVAILRDILLRSPYDALLLSAGGNDIVGEEDILPVILPRKEPGQTGVRCLDEEAFGLRLDGIRRGYERALGMIAELPDDRRPVVIGHKYDFVHPDPRGAIFLSGLYKHDGGKSWIYPGMRKRGIDDPGEMREITNRMLGLFGDMLDGLARDFPFFHVAQTQGLLGSPRRHWLNEIHPNGEGSRIIATELWRTLKAALAARP